MADLALNLVVIYSADLVRALHFYGALGLSFVKEQHGRGPEHYAAEVGPTVFEIYPLDRESRLSAVAPLGFRVPSLEASLTALRSLGVELFSQPKNTPWGRRAVVKDPDGRRVEISE
jgi:catechol 2,3-dioxygenase-like lactoylglutathione lyase family enzyme